jgi:NADH-quinone oxidoreductase subunit G
MPKCTINGHELEVKDGTTIMEAFAQIPQDIAYYCWHPGLSVAGVCRLCMVEIEGNPRLQIACNTAVTEGMKVNNKSDKVKESVKWGLDFHLINHPLDCPICDQAGECGLQDQYMHYGRYTPEMAERKVKKRKVVELGERVVLDSERCILCSRCVRFTEEVSKTNELGIFNRGDRSEIGTFDDKPLNNNYSLNTVDICPVGALTSKDFRFKQRVWFLKSADTVCTGCSTGCNVKVSYNKEGAFRVKPVYNPEVNGYWMCDQGRDVYKFINREYRLLDARQQINGQVTTMAPGAAAKMMGEKLRAQVQKHGVDSVALVVTGQHTNEELDALVGLFAKEWKSKNVFHWVNNRETFESFDGILYRGDHNPNTAGAVRILEKHNVKGTWSELVAGIQSGKIQTVVVAGPENQEVYPDMKERIAELAKAANLIWLTAGKSPTLDNLANICQIPLKVYVEKNGTFVNYKGREQKIKKGFVIVGQALTLEEVAQLFSGQEVKPHSQDEQLHGRVHNEFVYVRGSL